MRKIGTRGLDWQRDYLRTVDTLGKVEFEWGVYWDFIKAYCSSESGKR